MVANAAVQSDKTLLVTLAPLVSSTPYCAFSLVLTLMVSLRLMMMIMEIDAFLNPGLFPTVGYTHLELLVKLYPGYTSNSFSILLSYLTSSHLISS